MGFGREIKFPTISPSSYLGIHSHSDLHGFIGGLVVIPFLDARYLAGFFHASRLFSFVDGPAMLEPSKTVEPFMTE